MQAMPRAFWLAGNIEPSVEEANGWRDDTGRQELEARAAGKKATAETQTAFGSSGIALSQRPSTSLPPARRNQQAGVVQTFFQPTTAGMVMTFYFDSLVAQADLQSASVEIVGDDSLLVQVHSQRITYRLPQDLRDQLRSQVRQTK
jgi:hypothetical protein